MEIEVLEGTIGHGAGICDERIDEIKDDFT